MDHKITARLAQADTSSSQPATGKYQMALVTMTYIHNIWICPQTSGCHRALPIYALARIERINAVISAVASAATKYTSGTRTMPTSSLLSTVFESEIGRDFQNRMLRSLRSVYRQSKRYQAAYSD